MSPPYPRQGQAERSVRSSVSQQGIERGYRPSLSPLPEHQSPMSPDYRPFVVNASGVGTALATAAKESFALACSTMEECVALLVASIDDDYEEEYDDRIPQKPQGMHRNTSDEELNQSHSS